MASRAKRASTSKTKKTGTSKQDAALAKARAAAKTAHPKGSLTPAQLAADRANLVLAREAQAHSKRAQTPKMLAAERANMAKARMAEKSAHGAGHQTPKQLAAEARNLVKARAAFFAKYGHAYGSYTHSKGHHRSVKPDKLVRPLGLTQINTRLRTKLEQARLTGRFPAFQKEIGTTSYGQRTSWHKARSHHMVKRLHSRKKTLIKNGKWRHSRHQLVPR